MLKILILLTALGFTPENPIGDMQAIGWMAGGAAIGDLYLDSNNLYWDDGTDADTFCVYVSADSIKCQIGGVDLGFSESTDISITTSAADLILNPNSQISFASPVELNSQTVYFDDGTDADTFIDYVGADSFKFQVGGVDLTIAESTDISFTTSAGDISLVPNGGDVSVTGNVMVGASNMFNFSGRTEITASADGKLKITDDAATSGVVLGYFYLEESCR
jgi:hypothetical protein